MAVEKSAGLLRKSVELGNTSAYRKGFYGQFLGTNAPVLIVSPSSSSWSGWRASTDPRFKPCKARPSTSTHAILIASDQEWACRNRRQFQRHLHHSLQLYTLSFSDLNPEHSSGDGVRSKQPEHCVYATSF